MLAVARNVRKSRSTRNATRPKPATAATTRAALTTYHTGPP